MPRIDKLIVTHRGALREKYGGGVTRIDEAVQALLKSDADRGLVTRVVSLDDATALGRHGAAVASPDDPRGAKDAYWGQRFLALLTEPQLQAKYANLMSYPGLHQDAIKYTDPKMVPFLPTSENNLGKQAWSDAGWWNDNADKVEERWNRFMLAR